MTDQTPEPTTDPMSPEQQAESWYRRWEIAVDENGKLANQINGAYRERAHLVALLAAIYPSTWNTDPEQTDWPVVYIQTPQGQLSWHIAPTDWALFPHVPGPSGEWDGHTTDEKYQRIRAIVAAAVPADTRETSGT